jgi:predicted nucleotidyltransferase
MAEGQDRKVIRVADEESPGRDPKIAAFARDMLPRLQERFAPLTALVFGSRARGDALSTSDLDLILVSPRFASVPFLERPVQVLEMLGFPGGLELLCYTPDKFETKREELRIVRVALAEGFVL